MDYIVLCCLDCWLNYWYEIGFDCNVLKIVFVIFGSKICTRCPSLSFVVNEISRNKVVVPEGVAGVICRPFLLVEISFTLNFLSCDSAWSDY
jgi:hypothetical protein